MAVCGRRPETPGSFTPCPAPCACGQEVAAKAAAAGGGTSDTRQFTVTVRRIGRRWNGLTPNPNTEENR